ncbi:hypothetical protein PV08_09104 [Exophiala spinifera]|uniref:Uncharacterized protein n=1 Tax=Exophiala spinifera TaxID=91928 RepID=A0A0D1YA54_9EURO|nr:uncharacterized protein PV08_09104 [Exophiala spinifera]KIW11831.1 hypothetical protein PV08_09104 [Exophiala spinifera]
MENLPPDFWATSGAYTPHIYRDQYPSIDPASSKLSQAGKTIIITGASAGIGRRGIVPAFAKAGPKALVLVARSLASLEATEAVVREINPSIKVLLVPTSISDEAAVTSLYETVRTTLGHADVLVNNAGSNTEVALIGDSTPAKWWADFETNVRGTYLMTRGFLQLLGPEQKGTVITLNTGLATAVVPSWSSYSISKIASLQLVDYLAAEYSNVSAVSIQPGVVDTDMVNESFKRFAQDTPELVGGTCVWLATDAARFLSGRFVSANWSVDDLQAQKDHIVSSSDLKVAYQGTFGLDKIRAAE